MLRWENVLERHDLFSFGWQKATGKRPRISYDRRVNQGAVLKRFGRYLVEFREESSCVEQ